MEFGSHAVPYHAAKFCFDYKFLPALSFEVPLSELPGLLVCMWDRAVLDTGKHLVGVLSKIKARGPDI